jgi:AcrR family transcriptional regulator
MIAVNDHPASTQPHGAGDQADAQSPRRSKRAHEAILTAAAELIHERPYADVCIEAIAARAGVGKQTIYRWWTSKAAVLMDACAAHVARELPLPDQGAVRDDLRAYLTHVCSYFTNQLSKPAIAGLLAEAQCDAELARAFRQRLLMQRRELLRSLLERGVARGELRDDTDLGVVTDMIYGALWYRMLFLNLPLDETFVEQVIDQTIAGIAAPKPHAGSDRGSE